MRAKMGLGVLGFTGIMVALAIGFAGSAGGQGGDDGDLFAQLRGSHEPDGGDRNGAGTFSAFVSGRRLCYAYTVNRIQDPVAAHIHRGRAGRNGPVVIPLDTPDSGSPGTFADCTTASRRLLRQIQRSPGSFYANVHTQDFPNGAVRGQLFHPTSRQDR